MKNFTFGAIAAIALLAVSHKQPAHEEPPALPPPNKHQQLTELIFQRPIDDFSLRTISVTATAYSATPRETNSSPEVTADMTPSRIGLLAISRDLEAELGLQLGETVVIPELGVFKIHDRMSTHKRKGTSQQQAIRRSVDILHANSKAALMFGKQQVKLIYIR